MQPQGLLAEVGTFCPNKGCSQYNQVNAGNIVRYGKNKQGRQRYRCKVCKKVFSERYGTLFYRKRTAEKDIVESLAMVAEGMGIRAAARVIGMVTPSRRSRTAAGTCTLTRLPSECLPD